MQASSLTPAYRSTSAILTAHGSAAATRTPMGCCASTFPKAPTSACTAPRRLQPWQPPSTPVPERRLHGKHLPRRLISCFGRPTNIMLRRPLESAAVMNGSPQYHQPVLEALCAFVRNGTIGMVINDKDAPATDIQAALTVIGRRDPGPGTVNLAWVKIPRADLHDANLSGVDLRGANLLQADLAN